MNNANNWNTEPCFLKVIHRIKVPFCCFFALILVKILYSFKNEISEAFVTAASNIERPEIWLCCVHPKRDTSGAFELSSKFNSQYTIYSNLILAGLFFKGPT